MLSDESSSDSETGRFKCGTNTRDHHLNSKKNEDTATRNRPEHNRFNRDFNRPREDRDRNDRYTKDRNRYSRHSPIRRRHSRERSSGRRSHDRFRHDRDSKVKPRDRSNSRDKRRRSRSKTHRSPERRRDLKEEIKRNITTAEKPSDKKSKEKELTLPDDNKSKRSEIHKPTPEEKKRKSESPIIVEEHSDESEDVQPGSYYSMIPAVVKEKSDESSEIDSSDDEKLRAKLLNLEKELHKTKRKKHKKKHKKKHSRSADREQDTAAVVEVTSTTDIQSNVKTNENNSQSEAGEITSTQKNSQKESGEEGEIISDDDSQSQYEIDPNDLRHKLKRSVHKPEDKKDVCGPALPPHLEQRYSKSKSPVIEGPILPPNLKKTSKHLGPSIPEGMRKILLEKDCEVLTQESSDEDIGIGPLPVGSEEKWSDAHQRLEERALDMQIRTLEGHSLGKSEVKSREQWMLELPEGKAKYLGLEARGFRAKAGPDMSDRSSWTDTPEEKAQKAAGVEKKEDPDVALRRDARARLIANRDEEQEDAVKKHKKKHRREESLLEMHEKKNKKKKKKDDKDEDRKERRPFSRDVDLQVNRFDEAQKKSIIKKAQALDTRFSRGEAKYL